MGPGQITNLSCSYFRQLLLWQLDFRIDNNNLEQKKGLPHASHGLFDILPLLINELGICILFHLHEYIVQKYPNRK